MSAFLIPIDQLPAAEEITGQPSFSVPCRSAAVKYMGTNWENCPPEIEAALREIPGAVVAPTWSEALQKANAVVIEEQHGLLGIEETL